MYQESKDKATFINARARLLGRELVKLNSLDSDSPNIRTAMDHIIEATILLKKELRIVKQEKCQIKTK